MVEIMKAYLNDADLNIRKKAYTLLGYFISFIGWSQGSKALFNIYCDWWTNTNNIIKNDNNVYYNLIYTFPSIMITFGL